MEQVNDRLQIEMLRDRIAYLERKLAKYESAAKMYTITDIVNLTSVSRWTVKRMLDKLGIRYIRTGRKIYVPARELVERWGEIIARPDIFEVQTGADG